MAFLRTPEVEWLYSGVTITNPSNEAIFSAHCRVWSFWYWPIEGGSGSSRGGRGEARRSPRSKSASLRSDALSYTHRATCSPLRLGRVLPRMMPIRIMRLPPALGRERAPRLNGLYPD